MDAPKGRYRVVEEDGRLVVIDNESGSRISSSPQQAAGRPGADPPPIVAPGRGLVDAAADMLLWLAVHEWDQKGRAVVRWRSQGKNGKEFRWDAVLDKAQQRRLGRGLLAFGAAPLFVLALIFGDLEALILPGLFLTAIPVLWGVWSITRLMKETGADFDSLG